MGTRRGERGFRSIERTIVAAIIGVLASTPSPTFLRSKKGLIGERGSLAPLVVGLLFLTAGSRR